MSKPVIADNKAKKITLVKGQEYWFCMCGRSNRQPFCDGSHRSTSIAPKSFTAQFDGEVELCLCKHSSSLPFCDNTHTRFSDEDVGKEGPGLPLDD